MMNEKLSMIIVIIIILAVIAAALFAVNLSDKEKDKKFYCPDESRQVEACIEIYQPVCGWFNPDKVQCLKYPCAETFSNSCFSCINENVMYYTEGECPE